MCSSAHVATEATTADATAVAATAPNVKPPSFVASAIAMLFQTELLSEQAASICVFKRWIECVWSYS